MATEEILIKFLRLNVLLRDEKIDFSTVCEVWMRHLPDNKKKDGIVFCTNRALRFYGPPTSLFAPWTYFFTYLYDNISRVEYRSPDAEDDTDVGGALGHYQNYHSTLIIEGAEPSKVEGKTIRNYGKADRTRWQVMIEKGYEIAYSNLIHVLMSRNPVRSTTSVQTPQILAGRYKLLQELGKGANGIVWRAIDGSGQNQAIKVFHSPWDQEEKEKISKELSIATQLDHHGLVRYYSTTLEEENGRGFIRMELVNGTSLKEIVQWEKENCVPQPIDKIIKWMRACIDPLAYLHSKNIIHRDLHAGNIMICNPEGLKLVDYGSARVQKETEGNTTFKAPGTLNHSAPETWDEPSKAGPSSDYFSLGVVLYLLTTGRLPFWENSLGRLHTKIIAAEYPRPRTIRLDIPEWLSLLIELLLLPDPNKRWHNPEDLLRLLDQAERDPQSANEFARKVDSQHNVDKSTGWQRTKNPYKLPPLALDLAEWLYQNDKTGLPHTLYHIQSIPFVKNAPEVDVEDAVMDLADKNLAQVIRAWSGTRIDFRIGANCRTPLAIPDRLDFDPNADILTIARHLAKTDSQQTGTEIQQGTSLDNARINRAILCMDEDGLIGVIKTMGSQPFAFRQAHATHKTRSYIRGFDHQS